MAWVALADNTSGGDVRCSEQESDAVPGIIVRATLGLSRTHWQQWLAAVERLDLAFFITAKHDCVLGRRDIKADHIACLLDEQRVGGKLERLRAMGLQTKGTPDALHA